MGTAQGSAKSANLTLNPPLLTRLRAENVAGTSDNSLRLYALLSLELWCRTFLDRSWSFDATGDGVTSDAIETLA